MFLHLVWCSDDTARPSMCQYNLLPLHHLYQLVLFTEVMVESLIYFIYACFSTHYQHVRTETRIRQSV